VSARPLDLVATVVVVANGGIASRSREELGLPGEHVRIVVVAIVAAALWAVDGIVIAVASVRTPAAAP
jgi:hypothetical protein